MDRNRSNISLDLLCNVQPHLQSPWQQMMRISLATFRDWWLNWALLACGLETSSCSQPHSCQKGVSNWLHESVPVPATAQVDAAQRVEHWPGVCIVANCKFNQIDQRLRVHSHLKLNFLEQWLDDLAVVSCQHQPVRSHPVFSPKLDSQRSRIQNIDTHSSRVCIQNICS